MTTVQPPSLPTKTASHWPSILQLILSTLAALVLIGAAILVIFSAIYRYSTHAAGTSDPTEPFMVAASLAFAGALVLPSAWYAWKHIAHPDEEPAPRLQGPRFGLVLTIVVFILVGGALLLGNWSSQTGHLTWLLLPLLNIIATGLPALWIIYIGTRGLISGAPRRQWGVFASGLVLGPLISLVLELFLLALIGILAIFWLMLNPTLANQLYAAAIRLQGSGQDINAVLRTLLPLLLNPGVLFLAFAFISVLVPLLEEALKPIGLWFLSSQKITPVQGFGYGVLAGAGFGLFENLGNTSGGSAERALLASTRISTVMLHSFTAGLMGWALASAWSERRYLRLAITYAIAVVVHGLWNGLAVLRVASSLQSETNISLPAYVNQIGSIASIGIIILATLVLLLYISFNTVLRRSFAVIPLALSGEGPPPKPAQGENAGATINESGQPSTEVGHTLPSPGNDPTNPDTDQSDQKYGL